jgi:hypothetical protein
MEALDSRACIVEKPSIALSFRFGDKGMIKAQQGLLERQSLEDSCLLRMVKIRPVVSLNVVLPPSILMNL